MLIPVEQCILFVIVNNVWFGLCKDTVLDFSKLVERCNQTPIRRKNVRKLMTFLGKKSTERVKRKELGDERASDHNHEHFIEVSFGYSNTRNLVLRATGGFEDEPNKKVTLLFGSRIS